MKNRLICLALCLVFVLSAFLTGCGQTDNEEALKDIEDANSESARTLTMWLVTEQAMDAATATAVTDKLNEITQSKFKTKLVLKFFTEDEYKTVLDDTICKPTPRPTAKPLRRQRKPRPTSTASRSPSIPRFARIRWTSCISPATICTPST